jgi:hypothetical protein
MTGGHRGIKKTCDQVQRRAFWPGWRGDTVRFCKRCKICVTYHRGKLSKQWLLQPVLAGAPTAPMAVFTPRPRPPSFSILPGPVVRGISAGILPSRLVDLVEDFPSVSANEIFETAVAHMGHGPRTQAKVKNTLEAITDARSRVAASLDELIEQSKSLEELQAGLRQLSHELSHC